MKNPYKIPSLQKIKVDSLLTVLIKMTRYTDTVYLILLSIIQPFLYRITHNSNSPKARVVV